MTDSAVSLGGVMQEFIARENIKRFRAQLRSSTDDHQKAILRALLKAEQLRLRAIMASEDAGVGQVRESTYSSPYEQRLEGGRR